jgi:hypothetical protein
VCQALADTSPGSRNRVYKGGLMIHNFAQLLFLGEPDTSLVPKIPTLVQGSCC